MKIRPVILSGGSGTRLWPISRQRHPKQFAELFGDYSLLMSCVQMIKEADLFLPPVIVGNADHKFFVLDVLLRLKQTGTTILLEPCGRNTAAAAVTAALAEAVEDEAQDEKVLHLLIPSDHVIKDHKSFFAAIRHAAVAAAEGKLALFGIEPTSPETGYGYIQPGDPTAWAKVQAIAAFKEKPDAKSAETLIKQGALWNSGIFLYDPQMLVQEVEQLASEQVELCRDALKKARMDLGCTMLDKTAYEKLQNISFDYLVMENTRHGVVTPCSMGWSDVGSWHALWTIEDKDATGNVIQGPVTVMDVEGSYIRSDGAAVGVIGLKDIAVVVTKDAVLVMPRDRSQDVKPLVAALEKAHYKAATEHTKVMRPWGSYEGVASGDRFQVKHIVVQPGQSLSLQMHHHRAEHWIVVAGTAFVECDDVAKSVYENESVFIPKGARHRLSNKGKVNLHLVEVQSGEYLGEDDIVRFSDVYGRVA